MTVQVPPRGYLFATQNDVDKEVRVAAIEILNQSLADTTDLLTQVKHAHWNVKGMQFQQLHQLFDDQAELLFEHADRLAERATALGGQATGTARMAASESRIREFPPDAVAGPDVVAALADRFATHASHLRRNVDRTADLGDADSADLFVDLSREVDKQLWFLESHLQTEASIERTGVTIPPKR
jgi:starvation-inducible DNA-binding protein